MIKVYYLYSKPKSSLTHTLSYYTTSAGRGKNGGFVVTVVVCSGFGWGIAWM